MLKVSMSRFMSKNGRDQRVRLLIDALIVLQVLTALYFLGDFLTDLFSSGDGALHTTLEGLAVVGLVVGVYLSIRERRRLLCRTQEMEAQLQIASGAFRELLDSFLIVGIDAVGAGNCTSYD